MTDFFAAYLFLAMAIILLVIGLWSKVIWILYISAVGWFMVGIYSIVNSNGLLWVDALGIFCLLAGVGTFGARFMLYKKELEQPLIRNRTKEINDYLKEVREARKSRTDRGY